MVSTMCAQDLGEAADLICGVFVEHEPTTRALGLESTTFLPFVRAYCQRAIEDGTGVVAREADQGNVVGALVCLDILEDVRERFPVLKGAEYDAKLPDLAFVAALEHPFSEQRGLRPGECAMIAQLAVSGDARGRGVGRALVERACDAARGRGYALVSAVCTSDRSRRVLKRAGFLVERTLDYATHEYEGRRIFAHLDGECALMVKRL